MQAKWLIRTYCFYYCYHSHGWCIRTVIFLSISKKLLKCDVRTLTNIRPDKNKAFKWVINTKMFIELRYIQVIIFFLLKNETCCNQQKMDVEICVPNRWKTRFLFLGNLDFSSNQRNRLNFKMIWYKLFVRNANILCSNVRACEGVKRIISTSVFVI